jgi:hypothetical protein
MKYSSEQIPNTDFEWILSYSGGNLVGCLVNCHSKYIHVCKNKYFIINLRKVYVYN